MIDALRKIFQKPKPTTTELFQCAGHTFKVLQPTTMSNVRKVKFFYEEYAREWGMTKQDLLDFAGVILKETEAPASRSIHDLNADLTNKLARIKTLVSIQSAMISEDFQYKPFLNAACVIVLIDDEDENVLSQEYQTQKLKLCREYPEIEAFFFANYQNFSAKYNRFSRYVQDMGMVTFQGNTQHGKHGLKRDSFDGLRDWDTVKYRDLLDFQQEKQKEIMIVAKAKGVNEDEIWKMGQMAYYNMLQVLEKYSLELKENQKV